MCRRFLAVLVLVACKDPKPEQPPPPPAPHDGVTLLSPGAAPLQVMRYRLTKGTKTTSELVYDIESKTDEPGQNRDQPHDAGSAGDAGAGSAATTKGRKPAAKPPVKGPADVTAEVGGTSPTLIVTLETEVQDVLADGTAKLRVTVVKTAVRERDGSPVPTDLVSGEATATEGVAFLETLAPDGEISDARVDAAAKLPDKARARVDGLLQGLVQSAMRLPHEPIGVGATWIERKRLPEGGIRVLTETTYTLGSITGSTIAYTSNTKVSGGPQTIEQEGLKVEVSDPRGRGETKGTLDLSRYVLDVASTSTFSAAMTVDAPAGTPGAGSSTVAVTVAVKITPTAAAEPATAEPAAAAQGAHNAP
jgi:hypothetical protein